MMMAMKEHSNKANEQRVIFEMEEPRWKSRDGRAEMEEPRWKRIKVARRRPTRRPMDVDAGSKAPDDLRADGQSHVDGEQRAEENEGERVEAGECQQFQVSSSVLLSVFRPRAEERLSAHANAKEQEPAEQKSLGFELAFTLTGHRKGVTSVKFSPDGRWLVSAGLSTLEDVSRLRD
jgi:WD40 repeat protein